MAREFNLRPEDKCPCGSGRDYQSCCGAVHATGAADSPEALMRSRYSAFCLHMEDFLLESWAEEKRPSSIEFDVDWKSLKIVKASVQGNKGIVNFIAKGTVGGKNFRMHEISNFELRNGKWVYVDGLQIK